LSFFIYAKLNDETLETIENLKEKNYGLVKWLDWDDSDSYIVYDEETNNLIPLRRTKLWFEDGKLFVETKDGKWVIEMEKVEEAEIKY